MQEPSEARKRFIADHPLEQELGNRGVRLIGTGDKRTARCPFHDDKNPSLSVDLAQGVWQCFAGCGGGSVVELIARFEGKLPKEILSRSAPSARMLEPDRPEPLLEINWRECVDRMGAQQRQWVVDKRGYRPEFVDQLVEHQLIGVCDKKLAFPIYTAGRVTGTHQRSLDGRWITRGGQDKVWVIGDHFENVLIFESQWDAFAFMDLFRWFDKSPLPAICSIVITRGASKGKAVQGMFPTKGRIICWMQNDQPDPKSGKVAADEWLSDIVKVLGSVNVARPPAEHKDFNDWLKAGAVQSQVIDLMESAPKYRDPTLPAIPDPLDFDKLMRFDPANDPSCLIGRRWLCRSGSCLWVGSSGLGKSVLSIQGAMTFAKGGDLFGLEPRRPLRSVIIGAEDDFGDLAEMVQGVLRGMGVKEGSADYQLFKENVLIFPKDGLRGLPLIGWAHSLVSEFKADLLWINPLLSYIACDINSSEEVGAFTSGLSDMQAQTGVCTMIVHHTGKPKESKTTSSWSADDYSYIGLGSSVLTNWARAIVVLQSLKDPPDTFVMRFAKRGNRTGIVDGDFMKIREVYLRHAEVGLCWVESDYKPGENDTGGRPQKARWNLIDEAWDGTPLSNEAWTKLCLEVLSVSDKTARRVLSKWSGFHIVKNTNDLWVKYGSNGQNGQNL